MLRAVAVTDNAATGGADPSGQPPDALIEATTALLSAVTAITLPLDLATAEPARRARTEIEHILSAAILPRLRTPDAPLLCALAGPTGVGKSTLLNALAGTTVSATGPLRPTTRTPVLVCNPADLGDAVLAAAGDSALTDGDDTDSGAGEPGAGATESVSVPAPTPTVQPVSVEDAQPAEQRGPDEAPVPPEQPALTEGQLSADGSAPVTGAMAADGPTPVADVMAADESMRTRAPVLLADESVAAEQLATPGESRSAAGQAESGHRSGAAGPAEADRGHGTAAQAEADRGHDTAGQPGADGGHGAAEQTGAGRENSAAVQAGFGRGHGTAGQVESDHERGTAGQVESDHERGTAGQAEADREHGTAEQAAADREHDTAGQPEADRERGTAEQAGADRAHHTAEQAAADHERGTAGQPEAARGRDATGQAGADHQRGAAEQAGADRGHGAACRAGSDRERGAASRAGSDRGHGAAGLGARVGSELASLLSSPLPSPSLPRGVALVDTVDGDVAVVGAADVVVVVVSAERYADAAVWRVLRRVGASGAPVVVVLGRVSAELAEEVGGAFVELLRVNGLGAVPFFVVEEVGGGARGASGTGVADGLENGEGHVAQQLGDGVGPGVEQASEYSEHATGRLGDRSGQGIGRGGDGAAQDAANAGGDVGVGGEGARARGAFLGGSGALGLDGGQGESGAGVGGGAPGEGGYGDGGPERSGGPAGGTGIEVGGGSGGESGSGDGSGSEASSVIGDGTPLVPEAAVAGLRGWLRGAGADTAGRVRIGMLGVAGRLDSVDRLVGELADAWEGQRLALQVLHQGLERVHTAERVRFRGAVDGGELLGGEVRIRWQELLGSGRVSALFEAEDAGRKRRKRKRAEADWSARFHNPAAHDATTAPLRAALVEAVARGYRAAVERAARKTVDQWELTPGAPEPGPIDDATRRATDPARAAAEWLDHLPTLILDQGHSRRTTRTIGPAGAHIRSAALVLGVAALAGNETGSAEADPAATAAVGLLRTMFGHEDADRLLTTATTALKDGNARLLERASEPHRAQLAAYTLDPRQAQALAEARAAVARARNEGD